MKISFLQYKKNASCGVLITVHMCICNMGGRHKRSESSLKPHMPTFGIMSWSNEKFLKHPLHSYICASEHFFRKYAHVAIQGPADILLWHLKSYRWLHLLPQFEAILNLLWKMTFKHALSSTSVFQDLYFNRCNGFCFIPNIQTSGSLLWMLAFLSLHFGIDSVANSRSLPLN